MKKYILAILTILLIFGLVGNVFASDAQRQTSKYTTSGAEIIQSSAGKVFSVTAIASANAGWIALYDSATGLDVTSATEPKIEIQEATAFNTGKKEFPEGLVFHNGIYLEGTDAKAIVYYH